MLKKFFPNKKSFIYAAIGFVAVLFLVLYFYSINNKLVVTNTDINHDLVSDVEQNGQASTTEDTGLPLDNITGTRCANGDKRPFAVMLAADKVARPLSGVSQADLVFEMPVITDGITRYMGLFKCEEPSEIGSIRSARHDFITLAQSMDAVYAHWGGSQMALDRLAQNVIDNIDALINPYNTFYRKSNIRPPHNGFTSYANLDSAAQKLKFRMTTKFTGYQHTDDKSRTNQTYDVIIAYPSPYNVSFRYSPESNSYYRSVGGFKEVDRNNNQQVVVKNLIIMEAFSHQVEDQYNDVDIETQGSAAVYRNGEVIRGSWQDKDGKYVFLDQSGNEVELAPGKIWISIVQPNEQVIIKNL